MNTIVKILGITLIAGIAAYFLIPEFREGVRTFLFGDFAR